MKPDGAPPAGLPRRDASAMAKTASPAWRTARRILAVRLDNLGDVLMTTPALRALRKGGERHITLLATEAGAAAAPYLPEVDRLLLAGAPWMPGVPIEPQALQDTVAMLRAQAFDACVIFTVYSQSPLPAALLCWMAGIPLRLAHCRENPYHLLSDWIPDPEPHEQLRHEVRRQLDLVAAVDCVSDDERLSFRLRADELRSALARLRRAGIDTARPWVVMHPGASAASRRYPAEHFAAAADQLAEGPHRDHQLVLTGAPAERETVEAVRRLLTRPAVSLAGALSLGELAAVIARASLLISNNTGPVHIASAVGTPVVDLYALTNPQHAPWMVLHRVLYHDVPCRYCYRSVCPRSHHDCLRLLEPERVAEAARELLDYGADRARMLPSLRGKRGTDACGYAPGAQPSAG